MTGEITLRGKGIANRGHEGETAGRAQSRNTDRNSSQGQRKDLAEIPPEIQADLTLRFVREYGPGARNCAGTATRGRLLHDAGPEVASKFERKPMSDQELTNLRETSARPVPKNSKATMKHAAWGVGRTSPVRVFASNLNFPFGYPGRFFLGPARSPPMRITPA